MSQRNKPVDQMKYKFNMKTQVVYGVASFLSALVVLYLFDRNAALITASIIGVINFAVAGFYTFKKCK